MGSSSSKCKAKIRLILVGLDNAGKTTILRQLLHEDPAHTVPTREKEERTIMEHKVDLHVLDLGGQALLRNEWKENFDGCGAIVYVVDAADPERLDEAYGELLLLLEEPELNTVPLLIFANKQDLPGALQTTEIVQKLKLFLIHDRTWQICPCSALNNTGLAPGIVWLERNGKHS